MRIEGEAVYVDAAGKRHSIEGIGSLPDDLNLQSLNVSGSVEFDDISCDKIKIEGSGDGKSLTAKNLSVEGSLEVDSVKVEELFQVSGGVKIGTISAGEIIMESRGGRIDNIKCSKIKIFHGSDYEAGGSILSSIFGGKAHQRKNSSRVQIQNIEANTVNLQNCEVNAIRCTDAVIGANCVIEKLVVTGKCEISDDAKVGETIRNQSAE